MFLSFSGVGLFTWVTIAWVFSLFTTCTQLVFTQCVINIFTSNQIETIHFQLQFHVALWTCHSKINVIIYHIIIMFWHLINVFIPFSVRPKPATTKGTLSKSLLRTCVVIGKQIGLMKSVYGAGWPKRSRAISFCCDFPLGT